jgi:hypothetical protein
MPDGITPNLSLTLPEVGASDDTWGEKTNSNWATVDQMKAVRISDTPPVSAVEGALWLNSEDNGLYISKSGVWDLISTSGGGSGDFVEAPLDGKSYGRRMGDWDHVISHADDIVDGGNY